MSAYHIPGTVLGTCRRLSVGHGFWRGKSRGKEKSCKKIRMSSGKTEDEAHLLSRCLHWAHGAKSSGTEEEALTEGR